MTDTAPIRPRARRVLLHLALALAATPLVGGALVVARGRAGGRAAAAAWAGGWFLLGAAISGLAPIELEVASLLVAAAWLVAGLGLAVAEARLGAAPEPAAGEPERAIDLAGWAASGLVASLPFAMVLVVFLGRWGAGSYAKPSFPGEILAVDLLFGLPLGLAVGLARRLAGRPRQVSAPLLFIPALPGVTALLVPPALLLVWLHEEVFELQLADTQSAVATAGATVLALGACALGVAAMAEYLAQASGLRSALGRLLQGLGVATGVLAAALCYESSTALAVRQELALRRSAAGDEAGAARMWRWILDRAPEAAGAERTLEQALLAALRAPDAALARDLVERAGRGPGNLPAGDAVGMARVARALAPDLDLAGARGVAVRAVRPESYLEPDHAAALAAVAAALPEVAEAALKQRLQRISASPDRIALSSIQDFADLRFFVRALGAEARPWPAGEAGRLLASGLPLLLRHPGLGRWVLVTWVSPGAGAVEWLDWARWDATRERQLAREDVERLLRSADPGRAGLERVRAEIRSLGAWSDVLPADLEARGGLAVAVAPAARLEELDPASGAAAARRVRLDVARRAVVDEAPRRALDMAARLDPGPERDEIERLAHLQAAIQAAERGENAPAAEPVGAAEVDALSAFGVGQLCRLVARTPAVGCEAVRRIAERLVELHPDEAALREQLFALEVDEGKAVAAARVARAAAAAAGHERATVLRLLGRLAPLAEMAREQDGTGMGEAFGPLVERVSLLGIDGQETRRKFLPAWRAGVAVLSPPAAAAREWQAVVELEPLRAENHLALAAALRRVGSADAAEVAERRGRELLGPHDCSLWIEVCAPAPWRPRPSGVEEED